MRQLVAILRRTVATLDRSIVELRLALGFLTILPLLPDSPAVNVADSFGWFPLVGFMIGALLSLGDWLLTAGFPASVRAALIVLALAVLTGAIHLDGLADTADALGAGRDQTRALAIMRDSRIGSFGTIALVAVLGLKTVALASMGRAAADAALYVAPGLARWAMVAVAYRMDYLRTAGAGATLLRSDRGRNLAVATVTTIVASAIIGKAAVRAGLVALIASLLLRGVYRQWLGGVTGDLIGAAGELVETAVLIAFTA